MSRYHSIVIHYSFRIVPLGSEEAEGIVIPAQVRERLRETGEARGLWSDK